jgi:hypothetical protein
LQDFLRAAWRWTELREATDIYKGLFGGDWPEEIVEQFSEIDQLQESHASSRQLWERERMDIMDHDGVAPEEDLLRADAMIERLGAEMHGFVDRFVARGVHLIEPSQLEAYASPGGELVLRTRHDAFGVCNAHNHFFALLTLRCLQRKTRRLICGKEEFVTFEGTFPERRVDYAEFLRRGIGGNVRIENYGPADVLLIRHGFSPARL